MRLFPVPIDLNAPKGDDEVEMTPLQLTRLRRTAVEFQRFVIGALIAVVLLGVVFVVYGWQSDRRMQNALDEVVAVRTEARKAECVRDNKRADEARASARVQAEVLVAAAKASGRGLDPAVNAAYVRNAEAAAAKLFPKRQCTPEAIAAYYQTDKR